jgi:hypothetical protein
MLNGNWRRIAETRAKLCPDDPSAVYRPTQRAQATAPRGNSFVTLRCYAHRSLSNQQRTMNSAHHSSAPSPEQDHLLLAQRNGWSLTYAQGYAQGKLDCIHRKDPGSYLLVGMDDYCSGFRAGYFSTARRLPDAAKAHRNNNIAFRRESSPPSAVSVPAQPDRARLR